MNKPCGIVLIDKPRGISSAGCVGRIRRMLCGVKVGHGGTLDPDATGLLVLFVGKATTLCDLVMDGEKIYEGEILAGMVTTTDDISGEVIHDDPEKALQILNETDLENTSAHFQGNLLQSPPQISAVKIDGKRAYLRARKGETFITAPRPVHISELNLTRSLYTSDDRSGLETLTSLTDSDRRAGCLISYRIRCSKGTYVRSLARDLGEYLKCGATVVSIRRTGAMPFSLDDASRLEDLGTPDAIRILPWYHPFRESPQLAISKEDLTKALNGHQATLRWLEESFLQIAGGDHRDVILSAEGISESKIGVLCLRGSQIRRCFFMPEQ